MTNESTIDIGKLLPRKKKPSLKVFAIKAYGQWAGGMAIVAAKDKEEAKELASKIPNNYRIRYGNPESVETIDAVSDGCSRVLAHYEIGE